MFLLTNNSLFDISLIIFPTQWVGWAVAYAFKTEKFYDLTGSLTFIAASSVFLKWHCQHSIRQYVQTAAVLIWATRLGSYLFMRIMERGKDRRFNVIKHNARRFFVAWTLQGAWVFVTLLPSLLAVGSATQPAVGWRDVAGWLTWLAGFTVEVTADREKTAFLKEPRNQGKFIRSGLWSISRHPNYLGEVTLWAGLCLSASSTFEGLQYAAVLSPVFIFLLITRVSGIPMLEAYGAKKWGGDPSYAEYVRTTPVLLPGISL